MKKILIVLVVIIIGAAGYAATMKPAQRPASEEKVEATPERLARGKYLVENVSNCFDCHAEHQWDKWGSPPAPGKVGAGDSKCFDQSLGFPGVVCFSNITPDPDTGIGKLTDGEIMRAIREGVGHDGRALFMMPYPSYKYMSDEDVKAVVAYLRTVPPVKAKREPVKLDFPVSFFVKLGPKPLEGPVPEPNKSDPIALGRYLTHIAGCEQCHTPVDDKHNPLPGMEFAGGQEFKLAPKAGVRSANITPHETGIGRKTKQEFIALMRSFQDRDAVAVEVPVEQNTVMPYWNFAHMTDEDLSAVYDFLRTVKPIENKIEKHFRPAPAGTKTATTASIF